MSKAGEYQKQISVYLRAEAFDELKEFVKENSNLPGPRGNLEMAYAFGDCFGADITGAQWEFLLELSAIGAGEAPTGDPAEMLSFCAALAAGSYYANAGEVRKERILDILRAAMNDGRWRMREAAAMGYQRIAEKDFETVKDIFDSLYPQTNFLEKRGVIAALAHPPILKEKRAALYCLKISDDILGGITRLGPEELKSEDFKVLSKGLEYAISVFTAAAPEEGFKLLKRFAAMPQKDIKRIIKSNLGKARIKDKFPRETEEIMAVMNAK